MTYNAAHRKPSEPSRWDRARSWLAGWLERLCGPEWHHGLTDQELAEEFGEDEPASGAEDTCWGCAGTGRRAGFPFMVCPVCYGSGRLPAREMDALDVSRPWEPPHRQVVTAIRKDGVYLLLTGGPPVDLRKYWWEPRICARRSARLELAR